MEEERAAGADKAGRRTHAARKPEMAGAWRRAARQNRERGKGRLTSGPGVGFSFLFFSFFLGCDNLEHSTLCLAFSIHHVSCSVEA